RIFFINMRGQWLKEFLLLQCIVLSLSESYYTIIGPGTIKSNRKYTVVVALHAAEGPCVIRVGLEGPNFNPIQDVGLHPFESKLIEFFPTKLLDGTYKLTARGLYGIEFRNESELYYNRDNGPKIYIQTDKGIYKPEDLIRFRIAILDEHSRPLYIVDPIRVEILFKHMTGAAVLDNKTPVTLIHGNKVYESFLNGNGEAIFEYEHQDEANLVFKFKDSTTVFPNIYASQRLHLYNKKLGLRVANENIRLGKPLQIEVTSTDVIP
ncbi:hypothetical protein DOY81_010893, partial [Sarcophaga bullata]